MMMDFEDYIKAAKDHLEETIEDEDGKKKPYCKKVKEADLETAKDKILKLLQSRFAN